MPRTESYLAKRQLSLFLLGSTWEQIVCLFMAPHCVHGRERNVRGGWGETVFTTRFPHGRCVAKMEGGRREWKNALWGV
jgi:hypothetical protein